MTEQTPRCYLTITCSQSCWFCSTQVQRYAKNWPARDELGADEWLTLIATMDSPDVVFTGGEPTLHRDFLRIVGECPKYMHVYSNFARDLAVPGGLNIHWRASCHAKTKREAEEWTWRVQAMHALGYRVTCTTVYPVPEVLDVLRAHSIHVDEPQACPPPLPGAVRCTLPRILVAPDGQRYHCVSKLVRRDPAGVMPMEWPNTTITCHDATDCLACDSIAGDRTAL